MEADRYAMLPNDAVSIGILIATAAGSLTREQVLQALARIGAPSWRPLDDVVAGSLDRLYRDGLLEVTASKSPGRAFVPTALARARLPELLYALPLSGASPDIGYKLKVMGLDLLEAGARERQLQALLAHWHDLATLWQDAEDRCPCRQPGVRGWIGHNLDLARSEIEWLVSVRDARTDAVR